MCCDPIDPVSLTMQLEQLVEHSFFGRGLLENPSAFMLTGIRTEYILENVLAYFLQEADIEYNALSAINEQETCVLKSVIDVLDMFRRCYGSVVQHVCNNMEIFFVHDVHSILTNVLLELFQEGIITWNRIVTYFVFVGEFTIFCLCKKIPEYVIDVIQERFLTLVVLHLEDWIVFNDCWKSFQEILKAMIRIP